MSSPTTPTTTSNPVTDLPRHRPGRPSLTTPGPARADSQPSAPPVPLARPAPPAAEPLTLHLHLALDTAVEPSPHVRAVAGMFGLGLDPHHRLELIPPTELVLRPGQVVFITGPSGGGKSSLLRLIADRAVEHPPTRARVIRFDVTGPADDRPLVDSFEGLPLSAALRWLSLAGLADAFALLRRPLQLSDGQRYRFQLARALADADRAASDASLSSPPSSPLTLLVVDEFGAALDRVTAAAVARNLRRFVSRSPSLCLLAATTHDDLLEPLAPDTLIVKDLGSRLQVHHAADRHGDAPAAEPDHCSGLMLEPGTWRDYAELAEHHYRSRRPATGTRLLALRDRRPTVVGRFLHRRQTSAVVGMLVESLPALSCQLRDLALHHRYGNLRDARQRAILLNREIRCISRVIVHPQWRGCGLAVRLVRAALDQPATRYTEALAAMGHVHPFFEKAGMTAYRRPPHPHDERLRAALGPIARAEDLAPWQQVELQRWHRRRSRRPTAPADMLAAATRHLHCEPVYYLRDAGAIGEKRSEQSTTEAQRTQRTQKEPAMLWTGMGCATPPRST